MIYEMRYYETLPGKLAVLNERMASGEHAIFERSGIHVVAFWNVYIGEGSNNTLIYLCEYPDLKAREEAWQRFLQDPEWQKLRAETEKDGPIVAKVSNVILRPTPFSPMK